MIETLKILLIAVELCNTTSSPSQCSKDAIECLYELRDNQEQCPEIVYKHHMRNEEMRNE